jgi:hypothetical protein
MDTAGAFAEVLLVGALLGFIPAMIASRKGGSFLVWWCYGTLVFLIALPHAILSRGNQRRCPHCSEWIQPTAAVCRHCTRAVPPVVVVAETAARPVRIAAPEGITPAFVTFAISAALGLGYATWRLLAYVNAVRVAP